MDGPGSCDGWAGRSCHLSWGVSDFPGVGEGRVAEGAWERGEGAGNQAGCWGGGGQGVPASAGWGREEGFPALNQISRPRLEGPAV